MFFQKKEDVWKRLLMGLAALVLAFAPVYLTVLLGSESMKRTELMLPIALAYMMVWGMTLLSENSRNRVCRGAKCLAAAVLTVALLWTQVQTSERLFYTDDMRQKSDERLAGQISKEIDALGQENPVVVFVGNRPADLNEVCLPGESIGLSFFDIFYANEPYYYHSTVRILDFLWTQGFCYGVPTEAQVMQARQDCLNMPCWRRKGRYRCRGM